jgi:hypothetical protein
MENNGNYLVRGIDLTEEQLTMMTWKGLQRLGFKDSHSFWFKDGKPSTEDGYYYPVCHSLKFIFNEPSDMICNKYANK